MSYVPRTGSAVDGAPLLDPHTNIQSDTSTATYSSSYLPPSTSNTSTTAVGVGESLSSPDGFKSDLVMDREAEAALAVALTDKSAVARNARRLMGYRAALGELCATFVLVYVACGTGIATTQRINSASSPNASLSNEMALIGGLVGSVIGSLTVAVVAMALIFSFASVSGAHMNPAVTVALWSSKRTSTRQAVLYVAAQLIGANLSMLALFLSFNFDTAIFTYSAVLPAGGANTFSVFFMEFVLTFILVFVIFKVTIEDVDAEKLKTMSVKAVGGARGLTIYTPNPQSKLGFAPLAIGMTIGVLGTIGASVSGGCYNPARYLAPAIWSRTIDTYVFAYVLAELLGGCTAALMRYIFDVLGRRVQAEEDKAEAERAQRQPGIPEL